MNQHLAKFVSAGAGHIAIPFLLLRSVFSFSWRNSLADRLTLNRLPHEGNLAQQCLWLHGASLGEVAGLKPIVELLKRDFPWLRIVVTTTSVTGKREVLKWQIVD